jgi:hypothetical protein
MPQDDRMGIFDAAALTFAFFRNDAANLTDS